MNHNDPDLTFQREIRIFQNAIARLQELPINHQTAINSSYHSNIKEGGFNEPSPFKQQQLLPVFHSITNTQDSELERSSMVSLRDLQPANQSSVMDPPENKSRGLMNCCFSCFSRPDDRSFETSSLMQQYNKRSQKL